MTRMGSSLEDVLMADMVFVGVGLVDTPDAFELFKDSLNDADLRAEIGRVTNVSGPISGIRDMPDTAYKFTLVRDRIVLEILPGARTSITREYPTIEEEEATDIKRFAEVVSYAIDNTNVNLNELSAFGYNLRLVFATNFADPAVYRLGHTLFGSQSLGKENWDLIGGMGALIFQDGVRKWTFNVEPRPREDESSRKLYLHVNLHLQDSDLPTYEEIIATFYEIKNEAERFVANLT